MISQVLLDAIDAEIQAQVPQMIEDAVSTHTHNGTDSQNIQGQYLVSAPLVPITTASGGSLSSGGSAVLSNGDSTILTNALTRIGDLEYKLQSLGFLS